MPQNITDVNTFTNPVQAIADGDAVNASNTNLPVQALANRTFNLQTRLNAIVTTSDNGVRYIRTVASVAALQAVTDYPDGSQILVQNVGLYAFSAASTATALSPLVITPTAVGAGAGRWILQVPYGVANGLATLDASSKLTASQVPNRLVAATLANLSANFSTTGTTFVDTGLSSSLTCVAGDLLIVDAQLLVSVSASSAWVNGQIVVVDGGTTILSPSLAQVYPTAANLSTSLPMFTVYTVQTSGTVTVKTQVATTATVTVTALGVAVPSASYSRQRTLLYRP